MGWEKMENVMIKTLSNSFAKREAEKWCNTGAVFLLFCFLKMVEMTECIYIYGNNLVVRRNWWCRGERGQLLDPCPWVGEKRYTAHTSRGKRP